MIYYIIETSSELISPLWANPFRLSLYEISAIKSVGILRHVYLRCKINTKSHSWHFCNDGTFSVMFCNLRLAITTRCDNGTGRQIGMTFYMFVYGSQLSMVRSFFLFRCGPISDDMNCNGKLNLPIYLCSLPLHTIGVSHRSLVIILRRKASRYLSRCTSRSM